MGGGERQANRAPICWGSARSSTPYRFFWSQHYDVPIKYVGSCREVGRDCHRRRHRGKDCLLKYKSTGRVLAVASIYRDLASLQAELAMEQRTMR